VKGDTGEVGDHDVAWSFFRAAFGVEVLDVPDGLRLGCGEVAAARLVLGDKLAAPEQVDEVVRPAEVADGLLEATVRRRTPKT
jgi:hypothetical protein